jgi:hypothetical protein
MKVNAIKIFLIFFWIVSLQSCRNKDKVYYEEDVNSGNNKIIRRVTEKDGYLFKDEQLNVDSVNDGYFKEYYAKNQLHISGFFSKGEKDDLWKYFDQDGFLQKEENWFSNKLFGSQISYFNYKIVDSSYKFEVFSFYNISGEKIYQCKYNSKGHLLESTGVPLYLAFNKSSLFTNDSIEYLCFIGIPPGHKWNLFVNEIDINSKVLTTDSIDGSESNRYIELGFAKKIVFKKVYLHGGKYTWSFKIRIMSNQNKVICDEKSTVDVVVTNATRN